MGALTIVAIAAASVAASVFGLLWHTVLFHGIYYSGETAENKGYYTLFRQPEQIDPVKVNIATLVFVLTTWVALRVSHIPRTAPALPRAVCIGSVFGLGAVLFLHSLLGAILHHWVPLLHITSILDAVWGAVQGALVAALLHTIDGDRGGSAPAAGAAGNKPQAKAE